MVNLTSRSCGRSLDMTMAQVRRLVSVIAECNGSWAPRVLQRAISLGLRAPHSKYGPRVRLFTFVLLNILFGLFSSMGYECFATSVRQSPEVRDSALTQLFCAEKDAANATTGPGGYVVAATWYNAVARDRCSGGILIGPCMPWNLCVVPLLAQESSRSSEQVGQPAKGLNCESSQGLPSMGLSERGLLAAGSRIKTRNALGVGIPGTTRKLDDVENAGSVTETRCDGLVAYYRFDGDACDVTGRGHDGTVIGAELAADRFGRERHCYSFDGQSYIVARSDGLPSRTRTVSLWFMSRDLVNRPAPVLLGYGGRTCSNSYFQYLQNSGFGIYPHCSIPGFWTALSGGLKIRQWHHLGVVTTDAAILLYADGKFLGRSTNAFPDTYCIGRQLCMGVSVSAAGFGPYTDENIGFFDGLLDDVRIYDRALSSAEMEAIFNAESGINTISVRSAPEDQSVIPGADALFLVELAGDIASLQWSHNGIPVVGGTNQLLRIAGVHESDLGEYRVVARNCSDSVTSSVARLRLVANARPTILPLRGVSILEDESKRVIPLEGISSGAGDDHQVVRITAFASDPVLLASPIVRFKNGDDYGTLTLVPMQGQSGSATITVVVQDDGGIRDGGEDTIVEQFLVEIVPVNDEPTLDPIGDRKVLEDGGREIVLLTGISSGAPNEEQVLRVTAVSSNPGLIPDPTVAYSSPSATASLLFEPGTNVFGTAIITVTLQDDGGTANGGVDSRSRQFTVTVSPVNDAPSIVLTAPSDAQAFQLPTNIVLRATATDPDGHVSRIEFFDGSTKLGETGISPASLVWTNPAVGLHNLNAVATDDGGAQTRSAVVPIRVIASANEPPTIAILQPAGGAMINLGQSVVVMVSASDPEAGPIEVELLDEGAVVANGTTGSWSFTLADLSTGHHLLTALVTDDRGLTAVSAPVGLEVVDPLASVAIIGLGGLAEVKREQLYLLAMDRHSRVFAPEAVEFEALKSFQLIIWCGAGRDEVSLAEVATLEQLRGLGLPLYFIGERLASAPAGLSGDDQVRWQSLTKLLPHSDLRGSADFELQPEYLRYFGFSGTSIPYVPSGSGYEPAEGDAEGQVLGRSGTADVLVAFPRAGEPDLSSGYRSITQNLLTFGDEGSAAQADRQLLFQDLVCWLLRCNRCAAFNVVMDDGPTSFEVAVGEIVDIPLPLFQRYACVSTGVQFDAVLPPALEWVEVVGDKGIAYVAGTDVSVVIGEMKADERLATGMRLRALDPGMVDFTVHLRSHESPPGGEDGQRTYSIAVSGDAPPTRLSVERDGATVMLSWPATATGWTLESSEALGATARWSPLGGATFAQGGRLRQPVALGSRTTFFRLKK